MEFLDVVDLDGHPTGQIVSREEAHREGIRHRTAHVWMIREWKGKMQILLQKRSLDKDSYPGLYDTSSAGHIPAGCDPVPSALRELEEELGISAAPGQLEDAGCFHVEYEAVFHGKPFHDNEVTFVYVYREPVDTNMLTLQPSEVVEVCWFDLDEVWKEIQHSGERFCVQPDGMRVLIAYLKRSFGGQA